MKKYLMLTAAIFMFQATPALADHHGGKEKMFEKHDLNGDGKVSQEEFLEHAKKKFSEKDLDGDGSISKEEAQQNREEMKEKMGERLEKMKERREERRENRDAETSAE